MMNKFSYTATQKRNVIAAICLFLIVAINIVYIKIYNENHVVPDEITDKKVLVTGAAGFIGFHLAQRLVKLGNVVVGIDNYNDYYDQELKRVRGNTLINKQIHVIEGDICDPKLIKNMINEYKFTHIAHLAAQAGVRYSLENPKSYVTANLMCTLNLLETIRYEDPTIKFIYASSSSVYGRNKKIPFSEKDVVDHPSNIYGASKKAMEYFCLVYHELFGIHVTGLRFFTVYGPYGRPDMAIYMWANSIAQNKPLRLYEKKENGVNVDLKRDFTYIDDIVTGIVGSLSLSAPLEVFNLGNNTPEKITKLVDLLGKELGRPKPRIALKPLPKADITMTFADVSHANKRLGFVPTTPLDVGVKKFVKWYREYFHPSHVVYMSLKSKSDFNTWIKMQEETTGTKRFYIFVPESFDQSVINAYTTLNMRFVKTSFYSKVNSELYAKHLGELLVKAPNKEWQVQRVVFDDRQSTNSKSYDNLLFSKRKGILYLETLESLNAPVGCDYSISNSKFVNPSILAGSAENMLKIFDSNYAHLDKKCKPVYVNYILHAQHLI